MWSAIWFSNLNKTYPPKGTRQELLGWQALLRAEVLINYWVWSTWGLKLIQLLSDISSDRHRNKPHPNIKLRFDLLPKKTADENFNPFRVMCTCLVSLLLFVQSAWPDFQQQSIKNKVRRLVRRSFSRTLIYCSRSIGHSVGLVPSKSALRMSFECQIGCLLISFSGQAFNWPV